MALEDYTTYTLVEKTPGDWTVNANDAQGILDFNSAGVQRLYKDFGADHFDQWTHTHDIKAISRTSGPMYTIDGVWGVSNTTLMSGSGNSNNSDTMYRWMSNSVQALACYVRTWLGFGGALQIHLRDCELQVEDSFDTGAGYAWENTWWYLTISRTGTTLECRIYSDAARTTLVDTLSITTADRTYRYMVAANSHSQAYVSGSEALYRLENLDLGEAGPGGATDGVPIHLFFQVA